MFYQQLNQKKQIKQNQTTKAKQLDIKMFDNKQ